MNISSCRCSSNAKLAPRHHARASDRRARDHLEPAGQSLISSRANFWPWVLLNLMIARLYLSARDGVSLLRERFTTAVDSLGLISDLRPRGPRKAFMTATAPS